MRRNAQNVAVYALTSAGAEKARFLCAALKEASLFLPSRLAEPAAGERSFGKLGEALAANFHRFSGHVLFCAAGIAVRALAPLVEHKAKDPAVIVVDQQGRFAVSLLSGHLGGANGLTRRVARLLGGQAVITTATDGVGLPSLEVVGAERGMTVENLCALPKVSLALLEGEAVAVHDPERRLLPFLRERWPGLFFSQDELASRPASPTPLVWVGWRERKPAETELVMRPHCLAVGLGCNRDTKEEEIEALLKEVFRGHGLSLASISCLASVEAKKDEAGILGLADKLQVAAHFLPAGLLNEVEVPSPSAMVKKHMGTNSVCEAAAILAAKRGPIIARKHKTSNVTMAVALVRPPENSM
jgi:cobalt-precorrin 5A hydrolase